MANNKFKNLFKALNESLEPKYKGAQFAQGQDVPLDKREYEAPREIAGPPKPVEAVVPRILTDTLMGAPSTAAGILRMMYDYYPEKYSKTTKTNTNEAALPEWLLTAITDPNFRNTEQGKKAIEYAQKRLRPQEELIRKLALREQDEFAKNTAKYIKPFSHSPEEIPLADEGFKLVKAPGGMFPEEQSWHLDTPIGRYERWVNLNRDLEDVPSISYLKPLPENLKGKGIAAQAYTQLAKQYGTLRSDDTGATSPMIKKAFWSQFGQPFQHEFGGPYGSETRYEAPFSANMLELNKNIRDKYKSLGEQAQEEASLLHSIIKGDRPGISSRPIQNDTHVEALIEGLPLEQQKSIGNRLKELQVQYPSKNRDELLTEAFTIETGKHPDTSPLYEMYRKEQKYPGSNEYKPSGDNEGFGYINPNERSPAFANLRTPNDLIAEETALNSSIANLPDLERTKILQEYNKLSKQFPGHSRLDLLTMAWDNMANADLLNRVKK